MENINLSIESENWGSTLSSLSNLSEIHLGYCELLATIPSLLNLSHLIHLGISRNSFCTIFPNWL